MYRPVPILYRILDSFLRYRALFLLSVLVVTSGPVAYIYTRKTSYAATALTQCATEDIATDLGKLVDIGRGNMGNMMVSPAQKHLARFNEWVTDDRPGGFLDTALKEAHLAVPINIDPRVKDPRLAAFRKGLKATDESETIFSINLIWENPTECEHLVQALQKQYIEEVGLSRQAQSAATANFLDSELANYKGRMRIAEQALIDFKQNNAGQSPEAQSATMTQLSSLKTQYNNLVITSRNSELKRRILQAQIAKSKKTSILEQHIEDGPTITQIKELQAKRAALIVEGWLPTSDKVQTVDTQIQNLQQTLKAERAAAASALEPADQGKNITETVLQDNPEYQRLTQELTETNIDSNTQKAQMDQLLQQIKQYEALIQKIPAAEGQLNEKTRDFSILKAQYESLLQRREQARINTNLDKVSATSTLRPIGTIFAERTTTRLKKALMLVGLIVLGLVIGAVVTMLAEWFDPSLRYARDAERRLGLPVLVTVPDFTELQLPPPPSEGRIAGTNLLTARNAP